MKEKLRIIKWLTSHRDRVSTKMSDLGNDLAIRGRRHDNSYTSDVESAIIAKIDSAKTKEERQHYTEVLQGIHWSTNDYHVEYFPKGIYDMNMIQMIELICDRLSRYEVEHPISTELPGEECRDYVLEAFGDISPDLSEVVLNTLDYIHNKNYMVKLHMKKEKEVKYDVKKKEE